jgi:hypothetical protein
LLAAIGGRKIFFGKSAFMALYYNLPDGENFHRLRGQQQKKRTPLCLCERKKE